MVLLILYSEIPPTFCLMQKQSNDGLTRTPQFFSALLPSRTQTLFSIRRGHILSPHLHTLHLAWFKHTPFACWKLIKESSSLYHWLAFVVIYCHTNLSPNSTLSQVSMVYRWPERNEAKGKTATVHGTEDRRISANRIFKPYAVVAMQEVKKYFFVSTEALVSLTHFFSHHCTSLPIDI